MNCLTLTHNPRKDQSSDLGVCPNLELNLQPFGPPFGPQSTEPLGQVIIYYYLLHAPVKDWLISNANFISNLIIFRVQKKFQ